MVRTRSIGRPLQALAVASLLFSVGACRARDAGSLRPPAVIPPAVSVPAPVAPPESGAEPGSDVEPDPIASAVRPAPEARADCGSDLTLEGCEAAGGAWDSGIAGQGSCKCPTVDGGKPCRSSAECTTRCEIPWDVGLSLVGTRCDARGCSGPSAASGLPLGRCSTHGRTFGCRGWLDEVPGPNGPVRVARVLCTD